MRAPLPGGVVEQQSTASTTALRAVYYVVRCEIDNRGKTWGATCMRTASFTKVTTCAIGVLYCRVAVYLARCCC